MSSPVLFICAASFSMAFRIRVVVAKKHICNFCSTVCILADTSMLFEVEGCGDMSIPVIIVVVLKFLPYAASL